MTTELKNNFDWARLLLSMQTLPADAVQWEAIERFLSEATAILEQKRLERS